MAKMAADFKRSPVWEPEEARPSGARDGEDA